MGVKGKILSLNDAWGQDFILDNPLLRHDTMGLALTFSEIETVQRDKLSEVLSVFVSENRLVGRARARLALIRGLPRMVRLLKTLEMPNTPVEIRREGLRLLEALSEGDLAFELRLLDFAQG